MPIYMDRHDKGGTLEECAVSHEPGGLRRRASAPAQISRPVPMQVAGGLALDHRAVWQCRQRNVACLQGSALEAPAFGKISLPGMRIRLASIDVTTMSPPSLYLRKRSSTDS